MDPILGVQYPEIKTYDAYSEEDGSSVKLDVTLLKILPQQ